MRARLFLMTAVALLGIQATGQEFWQKKPYQSWSNAETEKMLHDSPWAQHVTLSQVIMPGVSTTGKGVISVGNPAAVSEAQHSELPTLTYTAQLRSAKPVREAVVRQRQLAQGYDSLPADKKLELDGKTSAYLARPQEDIVVYVTYSSKIGNYADQVKRYWKQQTYDMVKNSVYLTLGGERLAPIGYAAIDGAFQFNFSRPEVIKPEGSAVLEFTHPTVGALASESVRIEFKLTRMVGGGEPLF